MALGALLATALNTGASRSKTLTVGGLDVVLNPSATKGSNYGTPIESVAVTEAGPNGVSSMQFTIEDPRVEVVLQEGQLVQFYDVVRDAPIFLGMIQDWSYIPHDAGRDIVVDCIGYDAVLDWMVIGSLTIPTGTRLNSAIQSAYANANGVGLPLNMAEAPTQLGTIATPVGAVWNALTYDVVLTATTLREAILSIVAAAVLSPSATVYYWVDFYGGFRFGYDTPSVPIPLDYQNFTIVNATPSALVGSDNRFEIDSTGARHQVYVQGANAAGSGFVTDGTGLPGPTAILTDNTSDTPAKMLTIGQTYLYQLTASLRGSFGLESYTPVLGPGASSNQRAGTSVQITDVLMGLPVATTYRTATIHKTFNDSGTEDWAVSYGGQSPSAIKLTRRLTRGTLS